MFTEADRDLFHQGILYDAYKKMGAHPCTENGRRGVLFTVWAEHAQLAAVVLFGKINALGSFDTADERLQSTSEISAENRLIPMKESQSGIWEVFVPDIKRGMHYKFLITGADGINRWKADPFAFHSELRPGTASVVWGLSSFNWTDHEYLANKKTASDCLEMPLSIYEVYLGSWKKRTVAGKDSFLNYRELADQLSEYVSDMGFTHVELMGICEYPFDGSWGYQVTGYYSPTSRYGNPEDLKYFMNKMHQSGLGVIIDWVPAHFPKDIFGLESFDGTSLYESADPLLAEYPEWGTKAFDHSKAEVRNFLISNALYWINEFHADALRVDAVAAMLYTSFGRYEYRLNCSGGIKNLESIAFLKQLNQAVHDRTDAFLIAEDSSMEAGITKAVSEGGLGFLMKWNMGWMHDSLNYFQQDLSDRRKHFAELTHTVDYVNTEHFVNVISHDEVVHLKKSMLGKLPGNQQERLNGLKAFYTYQWMHPGKKLLFMGQEFAQDQEWNEMQELCWQQANENGHKDVQQCVKRLNELYKSYPLLHRDSQDPGIFEWINRKDEKNGVLTFLRKDADSYKDALLVILNTMPFSHKKYYCGVPNSGVYQCIFSTCDFSSAEESAAGKVRYLLAEKQTCDGRKYRICCDLRPYEALIFEIPAYDLESLTRK